MGVILDHLIKGHGVTMEQAKLALQPWQVFEMQVNGRVIGEYMIQNNEIHFALNDESKGIIGRKGWIKSVLPQLIEGRDFLVTKLFIGDKQKRLIEFFGFRHTHSDAKYDYFWLDRETMKCWL
jgi:hypothetical protein